MFFIGTIRKWLYGRQRLIFRFRDGPKWRYADPVAVGNKLEDVASDYQQLLITLAKKPTSVPVGPMRDDLVASQRQSIKKLAEISRKTFDLKPLNDDGTGITDGEAVSIIASYFVFMEGLARDSMLFRN